VIFDLVMFDWRLSLWRTEMKALIVVMLFATSTSAQSLADAARKAEEARKAKPEQSKTDETGKAGTATATKTYTNKDLEDAPPAAALSTAGSPVSTTETKAEATPSDTPKEPITEPKKDEAYWRAKMLPLQSQIEADRDALKAAERRYAESRDLYDKMWRLNPTTTVIYSDIVQVESDLKVAQERVKVDQRAIDDLMEEGRAAGALPGWFR